MDSPRLVALELLEYLASGDFGGAWALRARETRALEVRAWAEALDPTPTAGYVDELVNGLAVEQPEHPAWARFAASQLEAARAAFGGDLHGWRLAEQPAKGAFGKRDVIAIRGRESVRMRFQPTADGWRLAIVTGLPWR